MIKNFAPYLTASLIAAVKPHRDCNRSGLDLPSLHTYMSYGARLDAPTVALPGDPGNRGVKMCVKRAGESPRGKAGVKNEEYFWVKCDSGVIAKGRVRAEGRKARQEDKFSSWLRAVRLLGIKDRQKESKKKMWPRKTKIERRYDGQGTQVIKEALGKERTGWGAVKARKKRKVGRISYIWPWIRAGEMPTWDEKQKVTKNILQCLIPWLALAIKWQKPAAFHKATTGLQL